MMGLPQIRRSTYSVCFDFDAMQPCAGRSGGYIQRGANIQCFVWGWMSDSLPL